jgi:hypothetical protein
LEHIVRTALRKDCAARYQTAQELLKDLKQLQSGMGSKTAAVTAQFLMLNAEAATAVHTPLGAALPTRPKLKPLAVAVIVLLLSTILAYFFWKPSPLAPKPRTAEFSELFLDLGRWVTPPAGWTIVDERLQVDAQPRLGFPAGVVFDDFTLTFHLKLANAGGAAWALRVKDPDNYYLFYLAGPESNKKKLSYFYAYIVRDGKLGSPVSSIPVATKLTAGGEYTINISARKNEISQSINSADDPSSDPLGDPLGYFKDEDNNYPVGSVGFRTIGPERFSVDELYIRPLEIQVTK